MRRTWGRRKRSKQGIEEEVWTKDKGNRKRIAGEKIVLKWTWCSKIEENFCKGRVCLGAKTGEGGEGSKDKRSRWVIAIVTLRNFFPYCVFKKYQEERNKDVKNILKCYKEQFKLRMKAWAWICVVYPCSFEFLISYMVSNEGPLIFYIHLLNMVVAYDCLNIAFKKN